MKLQYDDLKEYYDDVVDIKLDLLHLGVKELKEVKDLINFVIKQRET